MSGSVLLAAAALAWAADRGDDGPSRLRSLEHVLEQRVNAHRAQRGLGLLRRDAGLDGIARRHSQAMASGRVGFGHAGFAERKAQAQRLVSLSRLAENVSEHPEARLDAVPTEALELWLDSAAHRANLEGSYELTGIGAASNEEGSVFVTQIFVSPRPPPGAPAATTSAH